METSDEGLRALSEALGTALQAHGEVLTLAESCTGGWIAKVITDVAGSSAWFGRGYVTYADEAKRDLLGVRPETLAAHGAVSEATVAEMAVGALERSGAGLAAAVSGVAGPTGGSEDKPVGTVWFGWARRGRAPATRLERFEGDREAVRRQSVAVALAGAIALLDAERDRQGGTE